MWTGYDNKMNNKKRKIAGLLIDLGMYVVMLAQMLYVFTGNAVHEWLGVSFFLLLIGHLVLKRRWFHLFRHRKGKLFSSRRFADLMILMLLMCLAVLSLSSMGVSRLLFPNVKFLGNPSFHSTLATLSLTMMVIHGGMHGYFGAKNKKKAIAVIVVLSAVSLGIGFGLVPYLNRHFRTVEIDQEILTSVESLDWKAGKPLVVYFTRVGNTDFDPDIDAVSGASLLKLDGELTGNTQFMAKILQKMLNCDIAAIQLTQNRYPSSYAETCTVGGKEIKAQERPEIGPIDVSDYDDIILVYPIWWGTIPMPVATFLESDSFTGKNIYLIATQGSSGFASSTKDIQALVPDAKVEEGVSVYCDDIPKSASYLKDWVNSLSEEK